MGTRRSRHNKGRKPLYKEFRFHLVPDSETNSEPMQVPGSLAPPQTARRPSIPKVAVQLEEHVAKYLESRSRCRPDLVALHKKHDGKCFYCGKITLLSGPLRATKDHVIPKSRGGSDKDDNIVLSCERCNNLKGSGSQPRPLFRREQSSGHFIDGSSFIDPLAGKTVVGVSDRDILLQMFTEHRLTGRQMKAGRIWQYDFEAATIQPNLSIDWSSPVSGMHYQRRGDITEGQFLAMKRRRLFVEEAGSRLASFLDVCLDADCGRSYLMRLFAISAEALHAEINRALLTLCVHLGFDIRLSSDEDGRIRGWRAVA